MTVFSTPSLYFLRRSHRLNSGGLEETEEETDGEGEIVWEFVIEVRGAVEGEIVGTAVADGVGAGLVEGGRGGRCDKDGEFEAGRVVAEGTETDGVAASAIGCSSSWWDDTFAEFSSWVPNRGFKNFGSWRNFNKTTVWIKKKKAGIYDTLRKKKTIKN